MRTPQIVPLAKQALDVLDTLRTLSGESEWLFPGDRNATKPMTSLARMRGKRSLDMWIKCGIVQFAG